MKKKIFIGMAALFFASISFYNVQITEQKGDIFLEHVALMAQANNENPPPPCSGQHCKYTWPDGASCESCCHNDWKPKCDAFGCTCEPPRRM